MFARVSSLSTARAVTQRPMALRMQRRYAGGPPSYNEPSGYLFGEKVGRASHTAARAGSEAGKGRLGAPLVLGLLWWDGRIWCPALLQARQEWATPEAEKRLDESGLPWRYKPSPNSGYPEGIPK